MRKKGYLGSVRFFKHLIIGTIIPIMACLLLATAALAVQLLERQWVGEREVFSDQDPPADAGQEQPLVPPSPQPIPTPESPVYTCLYPGLYAEAAGRHTVDEPKTCYLTFDDGPSIRTPEILGILDRCGIKATFFVVGREDEDSRKLMRRIVEEGHALGMHSYTHDYKEVYSSVESCLADYDHLFRLIEEAAGIRPQLIRFPGGSINGYDAAIYQQLIAEMTRRGFVYFDWNVATGDSAGTVRPDEQVENALHGCSSLRRAVVLMHDSGQKGTVEALPAIIEGYRNAGFTFSPLTPEVVPVIFSYK